MSACSCDQPTQALLAMEQAQAALAARLPVRPPVEEVSLLAARGRVLASPVEVQIDTPAWDNSAMDGYAFTAADLPAGGGRLAVSGRIAAGQPAASLQPGTCVRIFTGAPLPTGADTVVAQEEVTVSGQDIVLPACKLGQHVRRQGEELRQGDPLLSAGQLLQAPQLALLASQGVATIKVLKPLRVILISTGDELQVPGQPLQPGQIWDANSVLLTTLLAGWGAEVVKHMMLPDDLEATCEALRNAAEQGDILISSGGVSVGEEDYLKPAVKRLGQMDIWRLAIQPGKPLAFGEVLGVPWVGLPGNPVAALVTALMLLRPWLLLAQGRPDAQLQPQQVVAGFDWLQSRARRQFLRARIATGPNGQQAILHQHQGSAMLSAAEWAQGLVEIQEGRTFTAGETVRFWPFSSLFN